jgi:hypothetical protein
MNKDIRDEYFTGKFEETEDGLFFPRSRLLVNGVFKYNKRGEPEECSTNLVVDQGLNYILGAALGAQSPITTFYIAPFSGPATPANTWTGANFTANAVEWTLYTPATRPEWEDGAVASGGIDSFNTKASFTSTAMAQAITGAGLISTPTKSSSATVLVAASKFPSTKNLDTGEILDIGYGLQLTAVP